MSNGPKLATDEDENENEEVVIEAGDALINPETAELFSVKYTTPAASRNFTHEFIGSAKATIIVQDEEAPHIPIQEAYESGYFLNAFFHPTLNHWSLNSLGEDGSVEWGGVKEYQRVSVKLEGGDWVVRRTDKAPRYEHSPREAPEQTTVVRTSAVDNMLGLDAHTYAVTCAVQHMEQYSPYDYDEWRENTAELPEETIESLKADFFEFNDSKEIEIGATYRHPDTGNECMMLEIVSPEGKSPDRVHFLHKPRGQDYVEERSLSIQRLVGAFRADVNRWSNAVVEK